MSLVSVEEVRAIVSTPLTDPDLSDVIDREEARLARRIGPLTGSRTVTWTAATGSSLWLRRPVSAVTVTENGTAVGASYLALVSGGRGLRRLIGGWVTPLAVTFTPDDEAEVKDAVVALVAMRLQQTGFKSETIGDYAYIAPSPAAREEIIRHLIPGSGLASVRMGS